MRRIIVVVLVLAVAAVGFWKFRDSRAAEPTSYRLVEITKGNLASVVAATGNLQPVTTVQVGTQVSGIVDEVLVDFNSHVTAGQVIARIDKTLLISAVSSSRAQLERIEAEQRHAEAEYQRLSELHDQKMISDSEFNTAQYNRDAARASVKSAKVDLERAERNLGYATITSPIDGIVVQRSIDPGQTVQASFSAPQLFQIAGDLARHADPRLGRRERHRPDQGGAARQVHRAGLPRRLVLRHRAPGAPAVGHAGERGHLHRRGRRAERRPAPAAGHDRLGRVHRRPGAGRAAGRQCGAALPPRPGDHDRYHRAQARRHAGPGRPRRGAGRHVAGAGRGRRVCGRSGGGRHGRHARRRRAHGAPGGMPANRGTLWFTDENGKLDVMFVRTGITDGTNTEIRGREAAEGQKVIAGVSTAAAATTAATSSPFQQQRQSGPPRPGGF
jgi:HlyD family secretion protein